MANRYRNIDHVVLGGPSMSLISAIDRYVYNNPWDENEAIHFEDIPLRDIALGARNISENTGLHKVLFELAYIYFYLYSYDDLDWIEDISDFAEYVIKMFESMGKAVPEEFRSSNEEEILEAKLTYKRAFIEGLQVVVDSAFAQLWNRKSFLTDFNLKMADEIKVLTKTEYPSLYKDGQISRATYFPKWLINVVCLRERGHCNYCGIIVASPTIPNQEFDVDHMVPVAQGGTNDPTNLALSCPSCNKKKRANVQKVNDVFSWPKRI